jgi:PAS domain S-box-containing protein
MTPHDAADNLESQPLVPLHRLHGTIDGNAAPYVTPVENSPSRLEAILHASADVILTTSLDGAITQWNPAAVRLFGYYPEEIIGRSILTLIPPALHEEERQMLRRLRAGEQLSSLPTTRRDKNGVDHPVSLTLSPLRGARGEIVGTAQILRDMTHQKQLEEACYRLAAIVESSDDAIVSEDLHCRITSWNAGATRIFGYSAREILGSSSLRLIPKTLHGDEHTAVEKLCHGTRVEPFETIRLRKNGEPVHVSVTLAPIRDEAGAIIGTSRIVRDITRRKQLEQSLLQAEKIAATGRMAAAIAHQINNPLAAVLNLLFLARLHAADPQHTLELLTQAEEELARVAHIAQSTLASYREQASPRSISLSALMKEALRLYQPQLRGARIQVNAGYASTAEILLKKGEIMHVVSNLITNAIHAMPSGGTLAVKVEEAWVAGNRGLCLSVEDEGIGIAGDHLDQIFEPLFATTNETRTGIGLWIAKHFIEEHAGTIDVQSSTNPHAHGTKMSVFLPFANPYSMRSMAS